MSSHSGAHAVRLVVASPEHRRVLARPNGLAGWMLPRISTHGALDEWTSGAADAALAVLGTTVEPLERLAPDVWAVQPSGRLTAAGTTWIGEHDVARLGADADIVRSWFAYHSPAGDVGGG